MAVGTESDAGVLAVRRDLLTLVIIAIAILAPRVPGLDRFITIDEPRWLARSANFYSSLGRGDLAGTYQREHPGVTTMWAGTVAALLRGPTLAEITQGDVSAGEYGRLLEWYGYGTVEQLAASRLVMVLANAAALLVGFLYARRLLGLLPATVGFFLIAFDPFHLAHSRLLHVDGLQSSLLLLAVLAFLRYLADRRRVDLIVSGVATGLGCLTKSPDILVVPAIFLVALLDWWQGAPSQPGAPSGRGSRTRGRARTAADPPPQAANQQERRTDPDRTRRSLAVVAWTLLVWGAIALAAFVALWPAMWVDPVGTLADVTTAALGYAQAGHDEALYFQGQVLADGRMDASFFQFYPITFLWRTTPVILMGLLAAAAAYLWKRAPLDRRRSRFTVVALLLTATMLAIELNLAAKKFDRYLLPAYPLLDLVAATGWIALASWLWSLLPGSARRFALPLVLGVALLVQGVGSLQTFPYYLSYYNPLLGGSRKAPETMMIGWGEGLDEAARYLNARADARHLVVAACYRPAFAPFFDGTSPSIPTEQDLSQAQVQRALAADYVLSYANHWQRQMCRPLCQYLARREPEHSIWIDGLEYVRIYRLHGGATAR